MNNNQLIERYPELHELEPSIEEAFNIIKNAFIKGNKLFICGNGGSSSDADHIVGELMKGFRYKRKISKTLVDQISKEYGEEIALEMERELQGALPAISLNGNNALLTAFSNDQSYEYYFAQQIHGLAKEGDVILCLSTSGNSSNVVQAARLAKIKGMKVVSLTGQKNGALTPLSDVCIKVPEVETYKVQEYHLPIYHDLCLRLEAYFFEG